MEIHMTTTDFIAICFLWTLSLFCFSMQTMQVDLSISCYWFLSKRTKTSENQSVVKRYKKRPMAWNRLRSLLYNAKLICF